MCVIIGIAGAFVLYSPKEIRTNEEFEQTAKDDVQCRLMNGPELLSQGMCIAQLEAENHGLAWRWDISEHIAAERLDALMFIYEAQRERRKKVATDTKINLTTKEASVDQILAFLAIYNPGVSFVVAECIPQQLISIQLKDAPWRGALRTVLRMVGLRFTTNQDGTVYRISPITATSPP
ncbi:MAG: hypothetical protein Q7S24_01955 [bacterium]|nr:hypothetical protein [bacterium]